MPHKPPNPLSRIFALLDALADLDAAWEAAGEQPQPDKPPPPPTESKPPASVERDG